jgi:hypothetical protein
MVDEVPPKRRAKADGRREPGGLPTLHFALCTLLRHSVTPKPQAAAEGYGGQALPFAFMFAGHGEHV